jgi:hypothetical protein
MVCFQFEWEWSACKNKLPIGHMFPNDWLMEQIRRRGHYPRFSRQRDKGIESRQMADINGGNRDYSGLKHHAKVHSFRIITAILAWVLIGVAFYYRPDWIKWGLRAATHGIEAVGDALPSPWGDRVEIVLRELGGFIWIQITALIILIRVTLSIVAAGWRRRRRYGA